MRANILDKIAEKKALRVMEQKRILPVERLAELRGPDALPRRDFRKAVKNEGRISVIAEVKKASPSAGVIRKDFNPADIIKEYESSGADAISVITEEDYFMGSPDILPLVKSLSRRPALMKDFIIDEYQLHSAVFYGADCVLLIAKLLGGEKLAGFIRRAEELGLDSLVEVHDMSELDCALSAGAGIIGINNRDLDTFEVDMETTMELVPRIPASAVKVSESGIKTRDDIDRLYSAGVDAVLIGESLMRADDIGARLRELL